MQRLPKRSYQVYEDFRAKTFPTPADDQAQTDGKWMAYNRTSNASVPVALSTAGAPLANPVGHPGIIQCAADPAAAATQLYVLRAGQKAPLKDWGRFGITAKYISPILDNGTGFVLGFMSELASFSVAYNTYAGFWNHLDTADLNTQVIIVPAWSTSGSIYGEVATDNFNYNTSKNKIPLYIETDPTLADWFTLELEVDYDNNQLRYYVNGVYRGASTPNPAMWTEQLCPYIVLNGTKATSGLYIDELAFSTAAWEKQNRRVNRIPDIESWDLYDDFLLNRSGAKRAGEQGFYEQNSTGNSTAVIPSAVDGHPGVIKLQANASEVGGYSDDFLDTSVTATHLDFLIKDLKRVAVTFKPDAPTKGMQDAADACSVNTVDNGYNIALSWGYDQGYWELVANTRGVGPLAVKPIPLSVLPLPDGNTWFVCVLEFNYPTVTAVVNGVIVAQITVPDVIWNSLGHTTPVYLYTVNHTPNYTCLVDEVAIEFNHDLETSDERREDATNTLKGATTIRKDKY